jgi:Zn-dependent peptidase ImmA (M78 family)
MSFLSEKNKESLQKFTKFVKEQLGIKKMPTISIQNGRKDLKTTASYDYTKENKIVKINGKNRALVDVMRSLAHELVHHKQWEDGRLKVRPPDIGGEIEDEANAKAGQYIKMFAKIDDSIYEE